MEPLIEEEDIQEVPKKKSAVPGKNHTASMFSKVVQLTKIKNKLNELLIEENINCSYYASPLINEATFYFCESCDPMRTDPICQSCYGKCHKPCQKKSSVAQTKQGRDECICGKKNKHEIKKKKDSTDIKCKIDQEFPTNRYSYCENCQFIICAICADRCHIHHSRSYVSGNNAGKSCGCKDVMHQTNEFLLSEYFWYCKDTIPDTKIINNLIISDKIFSNFFGLIKNVIMAYSEIEGESNFAPKFCKPIEDRNILDNDNFKDFYHSLKALDLFFCESYTKKLFDYNEKLRDIFPYKNCILFLKNLVKVKECSGIEFYDIAAWLIKIIFLVHIKKDFQFISPFKTQDFLTFSVLDRCNLENTLKAELSEDLCYQYYDIKNNLTTSILEWLYFFLIPIEKKKANPFFSFPSFSSNHLTILFKVLSFGLKNFIIKDNPEFYTFIENMLKDKLENFIKTDYFVKVMFLLIICHNDLVVKNMIKNANFRTNFFQESEHEKNFKIIIRLSKYLGAKVTSSEFSPETVQIYNEILKLCSFNQNIYLKQLESINDQDFNNKSQKELVKNEPGENIYQTIFDKINRRIIDYFNTKTIDAEGLIKLKGIQNQKIQETPSEKQDDLIDFHFEEILKSAGIQSIERKITQKNIEDFPQDKKLKMEFSKKAVEFFLSLTNNIILPLDVDMLMESKLHLLITKYFVNFDNLNISERDEEICFAIWSLYFINGNAFALLCQGSTLKWLIRKCSLSKDHSSKFFYLFLKAIGLYEISFNNRFCIRLIKEKIIDEMKKDFDMEKCLLLLDLLRYTKEYFEPYELDDIKTGFIKRFKSKLEVGSANSLLDAEYGPKNETVFHDEDQNHDSEDFKFILHLVDFLSYNAFFFYQNPDKMELMARVRSIFNLGDLFYQFKHVKVVLKQRRILICYLRNFYFYSNTFVDSNQNDNRDEESHIHKLSLATPEQADILHVIDIFVQEFDLLDLLISSEKNADCIKVYLTELVFSVKVVADFMYMQKDAPFRTIFAFYKLAARFIGKADLIISKLHKKKHKLIPTVANSNGSEKSDNLPSQFKKFLDDVVDCEFDFRNPQLIFLKVSEVLNILFKVTKIYPDSDLSVYESKFDDLSFKTNSMKNDSPANWVAGLPPPLKKRIINEFSEQYSIFPHLSFFKVLSKNEDNSYIMILLEYFIKYFTTYSSKIVEKDMISIYLVISKLLFYLTEKSQWSFIEIGREKIKNWEDQFFVNMFDLIQVNLSLQISATANISVYKRFNELSSFNITLIQFLQLILERSNDYYLFKITSKSQVGWSILDIMKEYFLKIYDIMDLSHSLIENIELNQYKLVPVFCYMITFFIEFIETFKGDWNDSNINFLQELQKRQVFRGIVLRMKHFKESNCRNILMKIQGGLLDLLICFYKKGKASKLMVSTISDSLPWNTLLGQAYTYIFEEMEQRFEKTGDISQTTVFRAALLRCEDDESFYNAEEISIALKIFYFLKIMSILYQCKGMEKYYDNPIPPDPLTDSKFRQQENHVYSFLSSLFIQIEVIIEKGKEKKGENDDENEQEVKKIEKKTLAFFIRPPTTFYLSQRTKNRFLDTVNRESRISKLISLLKENEYFTYEMVYNEAQRNSHGKLMEYFHFEVGNYLFIVLNQILLFYDYYSSDSTFTEGDKYHIPVLNLLLSMVHIVYICLVITIWFRTQFHLSLMHDIITQYNLSYKEEKVGCPLTGEEKMEMYERGLCEQQASSNSINELLSWMDKLSVGIMSTVLNNTEINCFFFTLVLLTIYLFTGNAIALAFPAIFIFNFVSILKVIIIAIRLKWRQLLIMLLFTYITIYIFSMISFYFYSPLFENDDSFDINTGKTRPENHCRTLPQCVLTFFDQGFRNGGGIGDIMPQVSWTANTSFYFSKFFYTVIYHILILLTLGNIFFGIIVDAFSDLKEKTNTAEDDRLNNCFICNIRQEKCINENKSFDGHILEHKLWKYIFYIFYLRSVNKNDLNSEEFQILQKINSRTNDITWIPGEEEEKN